MSAYKNLAMKMAQQKFAQHQVSSPMSGFTDRPNNRHSPVTRYTPAGHFNSRPMFEEMKPMTRYGRR